MPTSRTSSTRCAAPTPLALAAAVAVALAAASACSAGAPSAAGGAEGGTSSGGTSSGGTSSGGASSGGTSSGCTGTTSKAEIQPLDLYLMLDRSGSMDDRAGTGTKWDAVSSALSSFVGQSLNGVSVGLQYFPLVSQYVPTGPGCDAAEYARPEVEIGPLASTASAIRTSIARQRMHDGTPTGPALQGAIDHAGAWARSHAGHAAVVVLATDGEPTTCDPDLDAIDAIAAAGAAASPPIRTFVIGVGRSLTNLNGIAQAGGTGTAFIVDAGGSLGTDFLEALNKIRRQAVRCTYAIPAAPAGQTLDPTQVNVEMKPGGSGALVKLAQVAGASDCGSKTSAWYYDDARAPKTILLCPGACSAVEADSGAELSIVLGCKTSHTGEW